MPTEDTSRSGPKINKTNTAARNENAVLPFFISSLVKILVIKTKRAIKPTPVATPTKVLTTLS